MEKGLLDSVLRNKSNLMYLGMDPGVWISKDQAGVSISYFSFPYDRLKAISG